MAVEVVRSLVVPPSEETRRHGLWLSTLDLLHAKRGHTPTVYLYPRHSADLDFFDVDRLTASLGKALVPFYPLAGRLSVDGEGRPEIDCAGQGVPLVIARSSNLSIDDLSKYQPSLEVKKLFVPQIIDESPDVMCAIQVTFLKCGGVVFGAALHHAIIDGTSACNFYKTWSAFSRSMSMDGNLDVAVELELPCHDHTLLSARAPPPATAVNPAAAPTCGPMKGPFTQEIFSIPKEQVAALKTAGGVTRSTFCAVSAHVWRCMCIARRLAPEATTQLTFLANFRRSLRPPLPDTYFGNAFIELGVVTKVEEIIASDSADHLASISGRVRDAIHGVDNEFVRSKLDCLEQDGAAGQLPAGSMPETLVTVVSWLGMPVYHNDFGWGKPQALMLAEQQHAGIIYLIDGANGDGSVNVMCTETGETLKDFKRLLHATYSPKSF